MHRESRDHGLFIPLTLGTVVVLAVLVLFIFVLPIVEDPRPRKPVAGGWKTTVWDKWTWERRYRQVREAYERELLHEKQFPENAPRAGSP
jgi:hypothetical protein